MNVVRDEWEHYLFEEGKDYSFDEAKNKAREALGFLSSNKARVSEKMLFNPEQHEKDFRLSTNEKYTYIQRYHREGYALDDCIKIVTVMDILYHFFDINVEKAFEMALYAADNHLTLGQTIKDLLKVDFYEVSEYVDTVLPRIANYFLKRALECSEELCEMMKEVVENNN